MQLLSLISLGKLSFLIVSSNCSKQIYFFPPHKQFVFSFLSSWVEKQLQKTQVSKNYLVMFCNRTKELVILPFVSFCKRPILWKSNFIPSAGDSQTSVFIRLRLTKGLECSLNFFRRSSVDYNLFFFIFQ